MARLPELVSSLAKVSGRDRREIEHLGRVLRNGGLIPAGKPGMGGAEMPTSAAVSLLIASTVWCEPKAAALMVQRYRSLFAVGKARHIDVPVCFGRVQQASTFGQALEVLIDSMQDVLVDTFDYIKHGFPDRKVARSNKERLLVSPWHSPVSLTVTLHRFSAEMMFKTWNGSSVEDADWKTWFHESYQVDVELMDKGFYGDTGGDRFWSFEFTGRTLLELWRVLQGDEEEGATLELRMA